MDDADKIKRAHRDRAIQLCDQGRYKEARTAIQESLSVAPDDWYSLRLLVMILERLGNKDEALKLCEDLLAKNPEEAKAYTDLAQMYLDRDKLGKASDLVESAINLDCEDADAFDLASRIASKQDDHEKMYQCSQHAYELDSDSEHIIINFAVANARLKQKDKARALYLRALEKNPDSASVHYCYATHLEVEGELDEALKHIKEALRLQPDHKQARIQLVRHLQHKIPVVSSLLGLSERIYWYQIAQVGKEESNSFLELAFALLLGAPRFILDSFSLLVLRLDARTREHVPPAMNMRNNLYVVASLLLMVLISSPVFLVDKVMAGAQPQLPSSHVTTANSEQYFDKFRSEYTSGIPLSATREDLQLLHKIELERPSVNLHRRLLTTLFLFVFEEGRLQFDRAQHYWQEASLLAQLIARKSTNAKEQKEDMFTRTLLVGYLDYINLRRNTRPDSPLWLADKGDLAK